MSKPILYTLLVSCIFYSQTTIAQPKAVQKGMTQAEKSKAKGQYGKAEEIYKNLLLEYPYVSKVWDELAGVEATLYEYYKSKGNNNPQFSISVSVPEDASEEDVLSAQKLQALMSNLLVDIKYKSKLEEVCRMGSCLTPNANSLNIYTRIYFVDFNPDSTISKEGKKAFNEAENEFVSKNFNAAAKHYLEALEFDSNYYKAQLYLGDVYYAQQNYGDAIKSFSAAKNRFPGLLEPRKYLIDALMETDAYEAAYKESIEALKCYPENGMQNRMIQICEALGYPTKLPWQKRDVLPVGSKKSDFIIPAPTNSPWLTYEKSYDMVKEYADKKGLLATNTVTDHKYIEIYAWEKMLAENTENEQFSYAREMQKEGFLDCFIFINCFHIDLMPQFQDFVKNNSQKIDLYFEFLKNR